MEQEILEKIKQNDEKLDKIFISVEKTRKYFLWVLILSVILFILPLIGMLLAIPAFLSTASSIGGI
ncbi:MAG: hypothetical protein M0P76_06810 [Candidatus Pacebacteria bacterium]|jgi:hypothetical protein|nr:hypothetical protein [Candidatus Paceibacterota bacterium]